MKTTNSYSEIQEKIITIEQLHTCLDQIQHASDALYSPARKPEEILETTLPYFIYETMVTLAGKNNIPLTNPEKAHDLLKDLGSYLENLPVAEIVIAYIPTYKTIQSLSRWWNEYTGTHVILAVQVDQSIIAGAKISYAGFYEDYSFSHWLNRNTTPSLDQFL